jgi:hypothetical protein
MALGAFGLTTNGTASDLTITAAGTTNCTPVTGLTGMQSLTVSLRFAWGSGGTAVKVYLQTSIDGGNTWIDIACVVFGNSASEHAVLNFSALTPKTTQVTPTDGALADDTAVDGILGDRVRVKSVSTGTYAGNTTLVGRMVAH